MEKNSKGSTVKRKAWSIYTIERNRKCYNPVSKKWIDEKEHNRMKITVSIVTVKKIIKYIKNYLNINKSS